MANYSVAYLDVLGFSNYVTENTLAAANIISDYQHILIRNITENKLHPPDSYNTPGLRQIAERTLSTSFECVLPFSDSLFLLSRNPDLFIFQMSHFLIDCFRLRSHAFAYPTKGKDPRQIKMKVLGIENGAVNVAEEDDIWFPLLMRGGVHYGEAHVLQVPSVVDGRIQKTNNALGKAVVTAVAMEKKGGEHHKGPRIWCTKEFAEQLSGEAAFYVGTSFDDRDYEFPEIYWPMALFETEQTYRGVTTLANTLFEPIAAGLRLWAYFMNTNVAEHYIGFIRLLVESAVRKYPDKENEIRKSLREYTIRQCEEADISITDLLLPE